MQLTYESNGTGTFLVYSMEEGEILDSMSMGMLGNNHIKGVLPLNYSQVNRQRYIKYNISSKISLTQYFNGVVNRDRLVGVMGSLAATVLNAEDYMLEASAFIWDKDYIYVDAATASAYLVCVPIENADREVKLDVFFKQLLLGVQFDQSENCDYVARLLGFFHVASHFSLNDFHRELTAIRNETRRSPGAGMGYGAGAGYGAGGGYGTGADHSAGADYGTGANHGAGAGYGAGANHGAGAGYGAGGGYGTGADHGSGGGCGAGADHGAGAGYGFGKPAGGMGAQGIAGQDNQNAGGSNAVNGNAINNSAINIPYMSVPGNGPDKAGENGGDNTPGKGKKKGFGLFGGSKEKPDKKEEKKAKKEKKEKKSGKEKKQAAAFGSMNIPGQPPMGGQAMDIPGAAPMGMSGVDIPGTAPMQTPGTMPGQPASRQMYSTPQSSSWNTDKTEILGDETEVLDDETEVLDGGIMGNAWLELLDAALPGVAPRIDLNFSKPFITLGRMSSDEIRPDVAFPREMKRIGRQHARIERRGTEYYIIDLGSANHTLLDNEILTPNKPYQLKEGMELVLTTGRLVRYRVHI